MLLCSELLVILWFHSATHSHSQSNEVQEEGENKPAALLYFGQHFVFSLGCFEQQ